MIAGLDILIIFLGLMLYPENMVFGNDLVSPFIGFLIALCVVFLFQYLSISLVTTSYIRKYKSETVKLTGMAVMNIAGVWLVGRFARFSGFGISSFWIAVILGIILTLAVYLVKKK